MTVSGCFRALRGLGLAFALSVLGQTTAAQGVGDGGATPAEPPRVAMLERPLRIALPGFDGDGSCVPAAELTTPGAADYARHLASRFERPIVLCLGGDPGALARGLAAGDVDMAWLDQDAYSTISSSARAVMTLRPADNIGRVPVVLFTTAAAAADGEGPKPPATLTPIGYVDAPPLALNRDRVFTVLRQRGAADGALADAIPYPSFSALVAGLREGEIALAAAEIAAHYGACRIFDPADDPCADLDTLSTQRPAATEGFVVAKDLAPEWRHRLVGVHVGLHLEAPAAFEWASRGAGIEFSPAEATALLSGGAEY